MSSNTLLVSRYLLRGSVLWVGVRLMASAALALSKADPLHLTFTATLWLVALASALGWADVQRRRESILLGNLGISPLMTIAWFTIPATIGESLLAVAAALR